MKIVVTGGAGFIGSNIVEELLRHNHLVRVIDNLSTGYKINVSPHVDFHEVDVRDFKKINEITTDFDVIIHLAANVGNVKSIENPIHDAEVNVLGTRNIISAVLKNKIPSLIYFSSAAIYGTPKYLPIDENHPCEPDSPYGVSKLAGEKDVLCMSRINNFRSVCFRPFNVYGKNQRFDAYGNVIPIFFQKIINDKPITIYGDGEQTRDFINVRDIVNAVINAIENNVSGIFNLATGKSITINQLLEYIKIATGKKIKINYSSRRKGEVIYSSANITNLVSNLNYQPNLSFIEMLSEYWEWFKRDQEEFKLTARNI